MEYFVQLVDALAWPVTVFLGIYLLRAPLIELIPQLKKLKYKELEMEFERELDSLSRKSQKSKSRIKVKTEESERSDYYLERVKELSPRTAIMESWIELESAAISTAKRFGLAPQDKPVSFMSAVLALKDAGVLTQQDVENISELRALRNKAAHNVELPVSNKEAAKFMEIARDQGEIIVGETWSKYGGCGH
jgi:uncharacterized protein YutE (UPF0331/DUF86 family)